MGYHVLLPPCVMQVWTTMPRLSLRERMRTCKPHAGEGGMVVSVSCMACQLREATSLACIERGLLNEESCILWMLQAAACSWLTNKAEVPLLFQTC